MTSDLTTPVCTALVVAGGASRRMGLDKLTWPLAGVPVLRRTLTAMLAADSIAAVVVVCSQDRWDMLEWSGSDKPVTRVDGGATRQDSVACGLAALGSNTTWVAVHDGARPLIAPTDVDRCVAAAIQHGAASLARRVSETMHRADDEDFNLELVSRDNLWSMETPQVFACDRLRQAYAMVASRALVVTDEVSAVHACGMRVKFVAAHHPNLKITTPADLALAAALLDLTA